MQCWTITWWWVGKENEEPQTRGYFDWSEVQLQLNLINGADRIVIKSHVVEVK